VVLTRRFNTTPTFVDVTATPGQFRSRLVIRTPSDVSFESREKGYPSKAKAKEALAMQALQYLEEGMAITECASPDKAQESNVAAIIQQVRTYSLAAPAWYSSLLCRTRRARRL
jgi:hypothetical protein